MDKGVNKVETIAEFLARGGIVNKVPPQELKKSRISREKKADESISETVVNMSMLPIALKIRYGVKGA